MASQGVLSEILNGKRKLNLKQIKLLAQCFNTDAATFIDDKNRIRRANIESSPYLF